MSILSYLFCCFGRTPKPRGLSIAELRAALLQICGDGHVGLPGDLPYFTWAKPFNLDKSVAVSPAAVVRPKNAQEVADVVKFAAKHGFKVQAKSGGHSYANFSLGGPGATAVIAIDLAELQHFSVDKTTWYATIGAGSLLGDVTTRLHDAGGRAFAHGVCPGVGIGGHATIGGLGPMSRMWGSCLDHIVEVEVVTADGSIERASETKNPDLFFGIRGAGASFGIVTEFVMRTHPEPGNVVQCSYTFAFGEHDMAKVFKAWHDLVYDPNLDRRLGTLFVITGVGTVIEAIFYGTQEEFTASGITARLPQPSNLVFVLNGWLGHLVHLAKAEALHVSNIGIPFYSKSLGFREQDKLTDAVVDDMFRYLSSAPKGGPEAWFIIFSAQGGATNDVAPNATSYAHRDKVMFYENYIIKIPDIDKENRKFFLGFHQLMTKALGRPELIATTYAGYVDLDLGTGSKSGPAYWGDNYPSLQVAKSKWDPKDVFHNPQSVRPVGSTA